MEPVSRVEVSFRNDKVGGHVRDVPTITNIEALRHAPHVVLLIHGYNNNYAEGVEAYNGFHARQQALDPENPGRYGLGRTFIEVFWPGDADYGVFSFLYYMGSVGQAQSTAKALAEFLSNWLASARIDIVAHSMGCRVAFELLFELNERNVNLNIGRIVCMAGAVPTFMLVDAKPERHLRPAYDKLLREGVRSLYSGSDLVLGVAFPAGQSLAPGEEGATPTALGHECWIDPSVPLNLEQVENPGSGHSDYWGWNTKPGALQCAVRAAQEVRSYLSFPSVGPRAMEARGRLETSAAAAREMALKRDIEEREMLWSAP